MRRALLRPVSPAAFGLPLLLLASLPLSACGYSSTHRGAPRSRLVLPHDPAADVERMMSRENGPFPKHRLQLFGGLATGEYEASEPAKPECTVDDAKEESCTLQRSLGKDQDGDPSAITCIVDTGLRGPFTAVLANRLGQAGLAEPPKLVVQPVGEGISVKFVANATHQGEKTTIVSTAKVATLYTHNYSATCSDIQPGGRKTFDRVVGELFKSLAFQPHPRRKAVIGQAYDLRKGEDSVGFRYDIVETNIDGTPGSIETDLSFFLETDEKKWDVRALTRSVERDTGGAVEFMSDRFFAFKTQLAVLTARRTEEGKFRLKAEYGAKSEALESTPKAPITTEMWAAGELAKVANGAKPSFRYSKISLDDHGEPHFGYVSLTRSSSGVLLEEDESPKDKAKNADLAGATKNQLHVDPLGFVTKQVSPNVVIHRVAMWGSLPGDRPIEAAKDAAKDAAKEAPKAKPKAPGKAAKPRGQAPR